MASQHPGIGLWYQDVSNLDIFEVVAIDEYSGTIELQYDSGDISELEFEQWNGEAYAPIASPEFSGTAFGTNMDEPIDMGPESLENEQWSYNLSSSDFDGLGSFES